MTRVKDKNEKSEREKWKEWKRTCRTYQIKTWCQSNRSGSRGARTHELEK